MARIRSVHPGLFTDEAWVSCSAMARVLVIGLWTEADDQGVFEWKPLQIKMRLLPADAADVAALLEEIAGNGLIARFEVAGKAFGAIRNFRKYQRPKKPNAVHPLPNEFRPFVAIDDVSSTSEPDEEEPVPNQSPTGTEKSPQMEDGGGREGGKEEEKGKLPFSQKEPAGSNSKRGTRLSAEYQLPEPDQAFAASLGVPNEHAAKEFERFRDFWISKAGPGGVKLDWSATWRNWIRKFADERGFAPTAEPGAIPKPAFTSVTPGTEQWDAWYRHKQRAGVSTRLMDEARNNDGAFVVPTEWPPAATATAA